MDDKSASGSDARVGDTGNAGLEKHLTPERRRYVRRFLGKLGFRIGSADQADLWELFSRLARVEEYDTDVRHNDHNWELAFASLDRRDEHRTPVVERLLQEWSESGKLVRIPDLPPRWPEGKRFCLCLSHDIDRLHEYRWREQLRKLPLLRGAPPLSRVMIVGSILKGFARQALRAERSDRYALDAWLEAEDVHGFRSTFFFMADPIPDPTWEDALYRFDDKVFFEGRRRTVRSVMRILLARRWEVGLHGSSRSHLSSDLLKEEKRSLEQAVEAEVTSVRQHHLLCDVRRTPRAQAEAGLVADSTFGSNVEVGFRCGTGLPFEFYDLRDERELGLVEVPLIVQDVALSRNCERDFELMVKTCRELVDRVAQVGGAMTVLWHNIWERGSPEHRCYLQVLSDAAARDAWGCSVGELAKWWRNRDRRTVD